jgi:alpha-D-ribose 1-methylphosphonate 5-triphosphate synthase subunit PhnI
MKKYFIICCSFVLALMLMLSTAVVDGAQKSDTAVLTVIKVVDNTGLLRTDKDGKQARDFSIKVSPGPTFPGATGAGLTGTTNIELTPDPAGQTYTVSETTLDKYVGTFSGDCDAAGRFMLRPGEHKTVTITNTRVTKGDSKGTALLTVVKVVDNTGLLNTDKDGRLAKDFVITINPGPTFPGGSGADLKGTTNVGVTPKAEGQIYTVSETTIDKYVGTFSGDCDTAGHVTIYPGEHKTVTITNTRVTKGNSKGTAVLTVIKVVDNTGILRTDKDGRQARDFVITVNPGPTFPGGSGANLTGTTNVGLTPKAEGLTCTVSETTLDKYVGTFSGDCDAAGHVTIYPGEHKTVTITNTRVTKGDSKGTAVLTVVKVVDNTGLLNTDKDGRLAKDFVITVNPGPTFPGGSGADLKGTTNVGLTPKAEGLTCTVSETTLDKYVGIFSGDCDAAGQVTIYPGEHKTVTITDTRVTKGDSKGTAVLTVIKVVDNTALPRNDKNGKQAKDFAITVSPGPTFPGGSGANLKGTTNVGLTPKAEGQIYTVSETTLDKYMGIFSGDCDAAGHVALHPGEHKTVTITNTFDNTKPIH